MPLVLLPSRNNINYKSKYLEKVVSKKESQQSQENEVHQSQNFVIAIVDYVSWS